MTVNDVHIFSNQIFDCYDKALSDWISLDKSSHVSFYLGPNRNTSFLSHLVSFLFRSLVEIICIDPMEKTKLTRLDAKRVEVG